MAPLTGRAIDMALTLPDRPGVYAELPSAPVVPALPAVSESASAFTNLAELTAWALAHRPDTRAVWLGMQAEAARLDAVKAADWPTLTAQFNFTQSQALASSGNSVPQLNRYGPSLGLTWTLYDFGARAADQAAQRWRVLASAYAANRSLQTVVAQVEAAYFNYVATGARVDAQVESVAALVASRDAALARARGGLATRADSLRASAALAEAQRVQLLAVRDRAKAEAALKHAVGVAQTQPLALDWDSRPPALDDAPAMLDALLTEALLTEALGQRPDLAALAAEAAAAREAVNSARAARWPVLSFSANVGRTAFLEQERTASTTYNLGLNVTLPVFDGGRLRAEARAAERTAAQREAELATQAQTVALDVAQARADVVAAHDQRSGIAIQFAAADESAKAADARYRAGLGSLLELLTAQADLARARDARAEADAEWLAAFSRLKLALGRPPTVSSGQFPR